MRNIPNRAGQFEFDLLMGQAKITTGIGVKIGQSAALTPCFYDQRNKTRDGAKRYGVCAGQADGSQSEGHEVSFRICQNMM